MRCHQPGALSQRIQPSHSAHDPDQTQRRLSSVRAIERAAGYILKPIIPAANRDTRAKPARAHIIQQADVFSRGVSNDCSRFVIALSILSSTDG